MRVVLIFLLLSGCAGTAWNTTVAETAPARFEMARSVVPGQTTETGFITRWGYPTQKIKEGAQVEYVYRDMRNPPGYYAPQWGDSARYVIVTFQYGLATGVRTSDGIECRATFVPRPPGYGFGNPGTHKLVGSCPLDGFWGHGSAGDSGTMLPGGGTGVPSDSYRPDGRLPK